MSTKRGAKLVLFVWDMKDFAFRLGPKLSRMRETFLNHILVEHAHFQAFHPGG